MSTNPALAARAHLVRALEADLVGPFTLDPSSTETLTRAPSRSYLTGFLAPQHATEIDEQLEEDELTSGDDEDDGAPEDAAAKGPRLFPASLGLSVLLTPASAKADSLHVTLRYAEYTAL